MRNFFSNTLMIILILLFAGNIFIEHKLAYRRGHREGATETMDYLKGSTDSLNNQLKTSRDFYNYRSAELGKITDRVLTFAYQDKDLHFNLKSAPEGKFSYEFFVARKVIDSIYNEAYKKYSQEDSVKRVKKWNPFYRYDYGR